MSSLRPDRSELAPIANLSRSNAYQRGPFLFVWSGGPRAFYLAPLVAQRLCRASSLWRPSLRYRATARLPSAWIAAPALPGQAQTMRHSQALLAQCRAMDWRSRSVASAGWFAPEVSKYLR